MKNTTVTPEEVEHYREEDIIPECEDRFPCLLCGVWSFASLSFSSVDAIHEQIFDVTLLNMMPL